MRSVCFFASYFKGNDLPYYITVYLTELKKQFTEVIFLTSQKDLSKQSITFLKEKNIQLNSETNEGFDFGLWYKAFQRIDVSLFDQVALINDSCILFKPLDEVMAWSRSNKAGLQGLTRSDAVAPHIQSYFLIINKPAIQLTKAYFEKHKIVEKISDVIRTYEIGLSTYLIGKGQTIAAFADNDGYKGEFAPYYFCIEHHLAKGMPVIKKKIIFVSYRKDELFTLARMGFNISPGHYIGLIKKFNKNTIIDLEKLNADSEGGINVFSKIQFIANRSFIKLFRPLYKITKGA